MKSKKKIKKVSKKELKWVKGGKKKLCLFNPNAEPLRDKQKIQE